jgi:hypothetical protein
VSLFLLAPPPPPPPPTTPPPLRAPPPPPPPPAGKPRMSRKAAACARKAVRRVMCATAKAARGVSTGEVRARGAPTCVAAPMAAAAEVSAAAHVSSPEAVLRIAQCRGTRHCDTKEHRSEGSDRLSRVYCVHVHHLLATPG